MNSWLNDFCDATYPWLISVSAVIVAIALGVCAYFLLLDISSGVFQ